MVTFRIRPLRVRVAVLLCSAAACAAVAHPADTFTPSVKFCNRTLAPAKVAISYDRAGTTNSASVGWYDVKGCTCRTILQNTPLRATEIFLSARRAAPGSPNLLKPATAPVCSKVGNFNMMRENASAQACAAGGGQRMNFKWYDTVGRPYTVNLRIAGQCNLMDDH